MFLTHYDVAAENGVVAGKLGVIQVILSGIERHATEAAVAVTGFAAIYNICMNGSTVTELAELQEH